MKNVLIGLVFISSLLMGDPKVLYSLDFSKQKDASAIPWLSSKGFIFQLDSKELNLQFKEGKLTFETIGAKAGFFGLKMNKALPNIGSVLIEWGVEKFPEGANWALGNNRVALGMLIALGTKTYGAGVPLVKSVPHFLGPFIGEKEKVGQEYLGKLYKKSGRYYCVSNKTGLQQTRFDIDKTFTQAFGKETPPLTAFAFQMNTKNTEGAAKAFIKKITFYSK
ncbi:MAG: hypothetical protein DRQ78_09950 [Epsilonproteobacteria bacterium]|nr:MAG: hypothetical protein DRQ78_09950 [Campylobacterota bacterium]